MVVAEVGVQVQERRLGSRYVLGEWLGGGAMGKVYKAIDMDDPQKPLAVKLMRPEIAGNPDLVSRFLQEARLLRSIDHENVVRILDLVAEGDNLGIVMEYVSEGDLRRAVTVPAPVRLATTFVGQVAEGLAAIHEAGITHRDLKPENILVERDAQGVLRPRVTDFGMSRHSDSASTGRTGIVGTTAYLSPEAAAGALAGPASDVYALGVILLELCTGRRSPFAAGMQSFSEGRAAAGSVTVALPEVQAFLVEMLAPRPEDRPSAAQVAERCWRLSIPDDGSDQDNLGNDQASLSQASRENDAFGNQDTLPLLQVPPLTEVGTEPMDSEGPESVATGNAEQDDVVDGDAVHGAVEVAHARPRADDPDPSSVSEPVSASEPRTRTAKRALALQTKAEAGTDPGKRPRNRKRQLTVPWRPILILAVVLGIVLPLVLVIRSVLNMDRISTSSVVAVPEFTEFPTTTTTSSATPTTEAPPTPSLAVYQPTSNPVVDFNRKAPLRISGVEAGSGEVASITVQYSGGSKKVTPKESRSTYSTTVTGLRNGRTYTFTVRVCNTDDLCTTSGKVTHTPYTTPTLQAPLLKASGHGHMTVTWYALSQNGHPGTWTCRISTVSTMFDHQAPQNREVSSSGGSLSWDVFFGGGMYTVTESCTYGSMTVRASSDTVQVR